MTQYGIDVASYQGGIDMAQVAREGFAFAIPKITEGTSYTNPFFHEQIDGAFDNGLAVAAYHALHLGNGDAQAAYCVGQLADPSIPIMLDWEAFGDNPDFTTARDFMAGVAARGFRASLLYLPKWYARNIGVLDADASGWGAAMVASNYVAGNDYASALYPGDDAGVWSDAYCGMAPTFWQFTSSAKVAGFAKVDANAFRGSVEDLGQYFKTHAGSPAAPAPSTPAPAVDAPVDIESLAQRVMAGEFGNGDDRRNALGANYDAVQARVEELAAPAPESDDALADKVLAGVFGDGDTRRAALGGRYDAVQAIVNARVASAPSGRHQIDTYTVQPGDNLTAIAKRYPQGDVTAETIAADNGIADANRINAGWTLAINTSE